MKEFELAKKPEGGYSTKHVPIVPQKLWLKVNLIGFTFLVFAKEPLTKVLLLSLFTEQRPFLILGQNLSCSLEKLSQFVKLKIN